MAATRKPSHPSVRRRRADAERSVVRILEATIDVLASDPEASMSEIAGHAGVVRATIYVHFPARESLIAAATDRAIAEVVRVIQDAEPDRGAPAEALARVMAATWRALGRFHGLIAVNTRLPDAEIDHRHNPALASLYRSCNAVSVTEASAKTCPSPGIWGCSAGWSTPPAPSFKPDASPKLRSNPPWSRLCWAP